MRKTLETIVFLFILTVLVSSPINATVIEYDAGTYVTPAGYTNIAQLIPVDVGHDYYYIVGLRDVDSSKKVDALNIVFRNLSNWAVEENSFSVYLFDEPAARGLLRYEDGSSTTDPDWEAEYNATCLGTWSYATEAKDVVFATSDEILLDYLDGGHSFAIGIDPECRFFGSSMSVEVATSPVPEPATLLLLGSGLLGLAGLRRKKD